MSARGGGPEAVPVVAAVVRRADRYLVGRRPEHKRHGGLWEFPGGKVREGESLLDAARRELSEELGLEVVALGPLLLAVDDPGSPYRIEFVEVDAVGDPTPHEHSRVAWLTARELGSVTFAPADATFVAWLTAR